MLRGVGVSNWGCWRGVEISLFQLTKISRRFCASLRNRGRLPCPTRSYADETLIQTKRLSGCRTGICLQSMYAGLWFGVFPLFALTDYFLSALSGDVQLACLSVGLALCCVGVSVSVGSDDFVYCCNSPRWFKILSSGRSHRFLQSWIGRDSPSDWSRFFPPRWSHIYAVKIVTARLSSYWSSFFTPSPSFHPSSPAS